ncbi:MULTISPECIES: branched-chain amino acid ABC transporter permease [unclassified Aminobacter]|jgi:branched-chain amino acid transport system permease protein|uniref:branched-chain amino acid ABC transporter permease n=1 Tax=unclassified Aminobacter TaxID=2644704 RepID=UPI00046305A0|nr:MULTISPECIES: branched-chain amino acid ABC transporter permease [unclassified Aminobacter]TWH34455.1 branched-chain amino acid transport system permease protein [Aminobacter sp. J15]
MSQYLFQQLINGLALGSLYALVAIGFSMIYGIVRLINFAHGDLVMIGAFATLGMLFYGTPWPVTLLVVLLVGALAGAMIQTVVFRPMLGAPQVTGFIASLAVSITIQNSALMLLSGQPRNFLFPEAMRQRVSLGGVSASLTDLVIIGLTLTLIAILFVIVYRTRLGRAMRATAENLMAARLMGIGVNRTIVAAFAIGSALAAVAGLFWGGKFGQIDPLLGSVPGLKAFIACVIGGVGSIGGAMLGGYILGLAEVLFVGLLPQAYAGYRDTFVFSLLILILLIKPSGLFVRHVEERA